MDLRSLLLLQAQLQRLRIDNNAARAQYDSTTSQQIPSWINHYDNGKEKYSGHEEYDRKFMRARYNTHCTALEDLRGKVVSVCKDEYGCEFLMKKLNERNHEDIAFIVWEVKDHMHDLMMDYYGSLVVQKVFEVANVDQLTCMVDLIIENELEFKDVCVHSYGSGAIQKLAEHLTTPEQLIKLTNALQRLTVTLTKNLNDGYV